MYVDEDGNGFNSEDEYDLHRSMTFASLTVQEWDRRDAYFSRCLFKLGFEIKRMREDGACLFRAIADQVYGDQEFHSIVRSQCMDYIDENKDLFEPYITEDFYKYVERKRKCHVHGNHIEIQALTEIYNRTIEVYCYDTEPMNIFSESHMNVYEPIRLSYHRMCHYNSIIDLKKPLLLEDLGLRNDYTRYNLDRWDIPDAQDVHIEQVVYKDEMKAIDWEAIEERVARDSYIQFYQLKGERRSTPTATAGSRTSRPGSELPKSSMSPNGNLSPRNYTGFSCISAAELEPIKTLANFEDANCNQMKLNVSIQTPTHQSYEIEATDGSVPFNAQVSDTSNAEDYQDGDKTLLAQVLEESLLTYLEDLNKRDGSPGPSTSH